MTLLDLAGHLSYAFIFAGMLLISQKVALGWMFRFIGNVGWCLLGFAMGMSSIWAWGFIGMSVDAYAFWKWRKNA